MKRLTKKQMIIFAIGQLGWSMLSGVITAWFVTFYLPTADDFALGASKFIMPGMIFLGLTVLGIITAGSRVFDAITDPWIANLSDKSKNPKGRRLPFMRAAAIPLSVVTVLLFCAPVPGEYSPWNIVWIAVFIILFYLFMTMYCTPYNALISEFGKTQDDRMFISTAISLTFFAGTMIAYTPFVLAGMLRGAVGFNWSYRICFIAIAVVACVCMMIPTFLLNEKEFVDTEPTQTDMFKSLKSTFKNREFRVFAGSDIMYWIGLTLFQTGLPFFVNVSMGLDKSNTMIFMGGMTVLSAVFYPFVSALVRKFGKKRLVIAGFLGLALAYAVLFLVPLFGEGSMIPGILVCVVAAFPMALLGVIPQSIIADVAEADSIETGENREGMFFAGRTFAMKWGQAIAMLTFPSMAIIGSLVRQDNTQNEIVPTQLGLKIVAGVAIFFCVMGAVILAFYKEKKIMKTISDKKTAEENETEE